MSWYTGLLVGANIKGPGPCTILLERDGIVGGLDYLEATISNELWAVWHRIWEGRSILLSIYRLVANIARVERGRMVRKQSLRLNENVV